MGDKVTLLPCPYCGAEIVHIESLARSFDPPRVYHEYRHPDGECYLTYKGAYRIIGAFNDNPVPRAAFVRRWNQREPAPLVWSSERPTKTARYWMRPKGSRDPKDYDCVRLNASEFAPAATWCDDYEFCLIPEPLEKESGE